MNAFKHGVLAVGLFAASSNAQPLLIDFESIPAMSNAPGAPIPAASQLRDQFLASHGVRFSSGAAFAAVVNHGPNTPSGLNIVGGATPDGRLTYNPTFPIDATFFDATGTVPRVVSVVSVRGDLQPIPGTKTLQAFDIAGVMLGSLTLQDADPEPLRITAPGIHRARFFSSSSTIGFDDLRFDTPSDPCRADFNRDGFLDFFDYDTFVQCFETDICEGGSADFNRDGFVDFFDYDEFVLAFETGC